MINNIFNHFLSLIVFSFFFSYVNANQIKTNSKESLIVDKSKAVAHVRVYMENSKINDKIRSNYEQALRVFNDPEYFNIYGIMKAEEKNKHVIAIKWFKENKSIIIDTTQKKIETILLSNFEYVELEYLAKSSQANIFKKLFKMMEDLNYRKALNYSRHSVVEHVKSQKEVLYEKK